MDKEEKAQAKYKSKNLMGYIQDKMDVGMAKLRSDEGVALDVAILKATLQDEVVPKEKHVRTLKIGCSGSAPRQQVNYVIHGLAKRLDGKPGWLVTLKTLVVFHRLFREVDTTFQEEVLRYQERTGAHRMLRLDGFADHTTKDTWDYSAWIRVYSVYLDERLGVFKSMRFDPEQEGVPHAAGGTGGGDGKDSKLKTCGASELLDKLPQIQRLLARLICCIPEGAAQHNEVVLLSCGMVLREVRSIYRAVCEGVINLTDKIFEMDRTDAMRGLEIYRENIALNERLNTFIGSINGVASLKGLAQFPALQSLPSDFLTTLEEYVKDVPKTLDASAITGSSGAAASGAASSRPAVTSQPPPAVTRSSTVARQGGTTSSAITGGTPPVVAAPVQGVLKIGPPAADAGAAAAPAARNAAADIDLLGDDFGSTVVVSPTGQQQQQASALQAPQQVASPVQAAAPGVASPGAAPQVASPPHMSPQQLQYAAYGAPPAAAYGAPAAYQQQPAAAGSPFGDSAFGAPAFPPQAAPYSMQQPQQHMGYVQQPAAQQAFVQQQQPAALQGVGSPVQQAQPVQQAAAAGGFGFDDNAFGSPSSNATSPAPSPAQQAAVPFNPFGGAPAVPQQQPYAAAPPPMAPMAAGSNPFGANPFAAAAPQAAYAAPPGAYPAPPAHMAAPVGSNPFGAPAAYPAAGSNPFGAAPGAAGAWGAPAPTGPAPVGLMGQMPPPGSIARKAQDPLAGLSMDLFGKPAAPAAPQPTLRDMKHQQGAV